MDCSRYTDICFSLIILSLDSPRSQAELWKKMVTTGKEPEIPRLSSWTHDLPLFCSCSPFLSFSLIYISHPNCSSDIPSWHLLQDFTSEVTSHRLFFPQILNGIFSLTMSGLQRHLSETSSHHSFGHGPLFPLHVVTLIYVLHRT